MKFKFLYSATDGSAVQPNTTNEPTTQPNNTIETNNQAKTSDETKSNNSTSESSPQTKTYSEEELTKLYEKFETEKTLAVEEALKKSKMNDDEKSKYEQEQKEKQLQQREKEIALKELKTDANKIILEKQIPITMADYLVKDDLKTTIKYIEAFKADFDKAVQEQVEQRLKGKTPSIGSDNKANDNILSQFKNALRG